MFFAKNIFQKNIHRHQLTPSWHFNLNLKLEIMKTNYKLTATAGIEFTNGSWYFADTTYSESETFESKEEAMDFEETFVTSLNIGQDDVYGIELVAETDGEVEVENIDVIDGSESLSEYNFQVNCEYGQYMMSKGKYHVEHISRTYSTVNELLMRQENSSFRTLPFCVFKTEEEVIEFASNYNVVSSVVKIETEEE